MSIEITTMAMNAMRAADAASVAAERMRMAWVAALEGIKAEVSRGNRTAAHRAAEQAAETWVNADAAAKTAAEKARLAWIAAYHAADH